jgi:hypothetical protein
MNDRIKELEAQCWEARQYGPPWFNAKKFAELIVRECACIADDMKTLETARAIKDHFRLDIQS